VNGPRRAFLRLRFREGETKMCDVRVALIGYGYWGPNLLRNFNEVDGASMVACSDLSPERLAKIRKRHPGITLTQNYEELLHDPNIDAVVIATPVSTHYPIARQALECGKHVMIEKPIADSSEHAMDLIERAAHHRRVLMVDHTFIYTSAVRKLRDMVDNGDLGNILYFDSVRVNLGLFQKDINVIWDLAPHDLSIMDFLLRMNPVAMTAVGASHAGNGMVNMAYLTLTFPNNLLAHFHVNWLAPVKIRMTLVGGSKKMVVYDDLEVTEKIRLYDKGLVINGSPEKKYEAMINYRNGDVWIPKLDASEALSHAAKEFVSAISEGRQSLTDGIAGYRVVRLLEAAQVSLDNGGRPVEFSGDWLSHTTALQPVPHARRRSDRAVQEVSVR
jgi:predicted dehydrogenase